MNLEHDMHLVDVDRPWRDVMLTACHIKICAKQIVVFSHASQRTYIYGSSAFGTLDAAQRRRRQLLKLIIATEVKYGGKYKHNSCERAKMALALLNKE